MPQPEPQTLSTLLSPWWLLAAVAVCLPVCVVVFWRIGRWWITDQPVPPPIDGTAPRIGFPPWVGLALFVAMQVLMGVIVLAYDSATDEGLLPWDPQAVPDILRPGLFLALAVPPIAGLIALRLLGRRAAAAVGVRLGAVGPGLAHGVVGFAAILPVCIAALIVNAVIVQMLGGRVEVHPLLDTVQKTREPWVMILAGVQAAVLAPLAEEFMYRGVLMMALVKQIGVTGALVVSSAVFGVVHLPAEPQAVLALFVLGMALGYVAHRTRSLVAPIVAHALFNALMVLGTFLGPA